LGTLAIVFKMEISKEETRKEINRHTKFLKTAVDTIPVVYCGSLKTCLSASVVNVEREL